MQVAEQAHPSLQATREQPSPREAHECCEVTLVARESRDVACSTEVSSTEVTSCTELEGSGEEASSSEVVLSPAQNEAKGTAQDEFNEDEGKPLGASLLEPVMAQDLPSLATQAADVKCQVECSREKVAVSGSRRVGKRRRCQDAEPESNTLAKTC